MTENVTNAEHLHPEHHSLANDNELREALKPFADNFPPEKVYDRNGESGPRSLYELLCRLNQPFADGRWRLGPVQAVIGAAKTEGVISKKASDRYGWWLREAWEAHYGGPILDTVVDVCGPEIKSLGMSTETVVRDMQIIWGIPAGMTFEENERQAKEDNTWRVEHPNEPPRATPLLQAGYNGFFKQNLDDTGDKGIW